MKSGSFLFRSTNIVNRMIPYRSGKNNVSDMTPLKISSKMGEKRQNSMPARASRLFLNVINRIKPTDSRKAANKNRFRRGIIRLGSPFFPRKRLRKIA